MLSFSLNIRSRRTLTACLLTALFVIGLNAPSFAQATESTLYAFSDGSDGAFPSGGLVADANGNFYGVTTSSPSGEVYKLSPDGLGGYTQSVLFAFGSDSGGVVPVDRLVLDSSGNLYGVTKLGGNSTSCGLVYKLSPNGSGSWSETVLFNFSCGADGGYPFAGVVLDPAGNVYGTTTVGGNPALNCGSRSQTCGVVYKLSPSGGGQWTESVLYAFTGGADGGDPQAPLLRAPSGLLLGTTVFGGANGGVVFALSPKPSGMWTESVIHTFSGTNDGASPSGALVNDAKGNLYGSTAGGGNRGFGTAFKLSHRASGWVETILFDFDLLGQGLYPRGVILDPAGKLYGTTLSGGIRKGVCPFTDGCGLVFELSPSGFAKWTETVLYSFTGGGDGSLPAAGVIRDSKGNLYGPAYGGGNITSACPNGCGLIFEVTP